MSLKMFTAVLGAAFATAAAPVAHAQFANMDINGMNAAFNARMNAQMNGQQAQIVGANMNDPRVMAMYRQNNRGLTPQQFAYQYAATGGFTPQGMQRYYDTSNQINNQTKQAWNGYQGAVQNYNNAYQGWTGGYAQNQQEAGRVMTGSQTYYDPASNSTVALRYLQPGQSYNDPSTGRVYSMGANGQYWSSNGNGYWTQVNPAGR